MLDPRIKPILASLALAFSFAAGWAVNGWRADARLARVESSQSKQVVVQAKKAQVATENKAVAVVEHSTEQQENTHDYTQEMARLEAGRAADAARIAGLQHDVRTAATRAAQAAGDAAACRSLADRHERLAAIAAEGAGLVGELGGLVQRRDAQITLLQGQVEVDRKLIQRLQ